MKSILITFAILVLPFSSSFGQGFGLYAGYNYSTMHRYDQKYKNYDEIDGGLDPISGFHVGAGYELLISNTFNLETGLTFSTRGYNRNFFSTTSDPLYQNIKTTIYYLEVPIFLKMKIEIGKPKLFAGVGPYFGWGMFGIVNSDGNRREFDFHRNQVQRFDSGLSFTAGMELGKFRLGASYQAGLVNIDESGFGKAQNRVTSLSVGYFFKAQSTK